MTWIWRIKENNLALAQFLHEENTILSSDLSNAELKTIVTKSPILYILQRGKSKPLNFFDNLVRLPDIDNCPLIHSRHVPKMLELFGQDVQFLPAQILTGSVPLDQFQIMRPKVRLKCVDFENSDVDLMEEIEFFMHYEKLAYLPNCLGDHNICQEHYHMAIVISDYAKSELEKMSDSGMRFTKPEDMSSF